MTEGLQGPGLRSPTSEKLLIFKRCQKFFSTFSKLAEKCPLNGGSSYFSGMLGGKRVVGNELGWLFEYMTEKDQWIEIKSNYQVTRNRWKGCAINNTMYLLLGNSLDDRVELLQIKFPSTIKTHCTIATPDEKQKSDTPDEAKYLCNRFAEQTFCTTPFPLQYVESHTITAIDCNTVMFVGGLVSSIDHRVSNLVYQGDFREETNDIVWKELPPLKRARMEHFTFKLKNNVYVMGGLDEDLQYIACCERFSLKECKWFDCEFSLPYDLWDTSVVVSADETFAVITGGSSGKGNGVIIFTEQNGFELMTTKLLNMRYDHASILL